MRALPLGLGLALALGAGAAAAPVEWTTEVGRDHPLVGRIWDVAAGRAITEATLIDRLARARYVTLGEKHDNPDHQRLQARILAALVARGRRPAVAFEMLDTAQAPALAAWRAGEAPDAAGLGPAVDWESRGWPPWSSYAPIAEVALAAGLPIVAANLPAQEVRRIARAGFSAFADPQTRARLGLDRPLDAAVRAAMEA